ncbi:MAG: calcineurin-like phosphoesterase family protein [Muribaculaceae bacterium]|nr:calcineurin-like phosphoesterase family protein [Muribaculaceae bacterium]
MTKKLLCLLQATLVLSVFSLCLVNCGGKDDPDPGPNGGGNTTEIKVTLPSSVDVVKGEDCRVDCENTLQTSDQIYLIQGGTIKVCAVTEAAADHFCFKLPGDFVSGTYELNVKRDDRRVKIGNLIINVVARKIEIQPGTTVYGVVESAEGPIAGVVVSDGVEVTTTDSDGVYQLKSAKETGYVFISVPSGYECQLNGVFPDHYRTLMSASDLPENQSFVLNKVDQSKYKIVFLGDMHVANRQVNNDLSQFGKVASDINTYVKGLQASQKVYGITLGDMTWDLYWYDRNYGPADYHETINTALSGLPIYHTIGNHDNDMRAIGNQKAKNPFAVNIAPPYYSFNIGDVHYIMLDNVDCVTYNGDGSRNHIEGQIYDPQWAWLAKDLAHVDKSTPILVMMHVPVFSTTGVNTFGKNMKDCDKLLAAFDGYQLVHYVTGHTHRSYNIVPENSITGGRNIYEHNLSAICSDWWWSGNLTPGLLQASDGTPCGYGVWDISGKDIKWIYKCAGKDENFQFRTYDLNKVEFSMDDVPNLTNAAMRAQYANIIKAYDGVQRNEVLINAWQKNSRWTCTVKTADGTSLEVKEVSAFDPVQIMAQTMKRFNNDITSAPVGTAQNRHHFYKVVAPDADTDLVITIKDEFGHTWTETMERPKAFDVATYRIDIK